MRLPPLAGAAVAALLAVCAASDPAPSAPTPAPTSKPHYRWHRGAAWTFHERRHPCLDPQLPPCTFAPATPATTLKLHVNTTIVRQLATVRVSFDANESSSGDFVGVYCVDEEEPATDEVDAGDFFDYADVDGTSGSVDFGPLVNMRCSYQFRYLRRVRERQYEVAGESAHVEMERGHSEPLHVRLALTDKPGEMRVMWNSGIATHVHVHYGSGSPANASARHAEASSTTYSASDMCGEPATITSARFFRHPGYMHDAVMSGLVAGETYYYRVGSHNGVTSNTFAFTFPPTAGTAPRSPDTTQSFIVLGDLGQSVLVDAPQDPTTASERSFPPRGFVSRLSKSDTQTVMKRIEQDLRESLGAVPKETFVGLVHIGDLSYARGQVFLWDQFGAIVQPVAAQIPYMVGIGNHEYDYLANGAGHDLSGSLAAHRNGWHPQGGNFHNDSGGECGVPTAKRFHMPDNGNQLFWYSFSVGLTHHVVLSSEHDCGTHSPMRQWLERELRRVDRKRTPWLIIHLHRPLYCSEKYMGDYAVSYLLRDCLERVFAEHRVDIVFSGHYHAYERTCPVFLENCRHKRLENGEEKALATTHIMVGSGGAELDDVDYLPAQWSANRQQEYGHGRLHIYNATHARFEFVRARDRVVSDSKLIISDHDWSYRRGE